MASSSSVVASLTAALRAPPIEKFSQESHIFWKTQFFPSLRVVQVMGLLDGFDLIPPKTMEVEDEEKIKITIPSQAYAVWLARDQNVMSCLVKSIDLDLLSQAVSLEHEHEVWTTIMELLSSHSRARVNMLRGA
jgi:hypothetical protein